MVMVTLIWVGNVVLALAGSSSGKTPDTKIPGNAAPFQVATKSNYIPQATYSGVRLVIHCVHDKVEH